MCRVTVVDVINGTAERAAEIAPDGPLVVLAVSWR
jgi:hypothetical protein